MWEGLLVCFIGMLCDRMRIVRNELVIILGVLSII